MLKYLPVQAGRWTVGIPLASVVEVRAFRDSEAAQPIDLHETSDPLTARVPALSLSAILGNTERSEPAKYGILMTSVQGVFGLLVQGMELSEVAASVNPLPMLVASPLFASVVAQNNAPLLLLNVQNLGQMIYELAAQELHNA